MKKILCLTLTLLLLLPASASAAWDNPQTTSPYSVGIIPVREKTDIFGKKSYTQDFETASAGDSIAFVIRVEVPENPRPAQLHLTGQNATINSALLATLPDAPGLYYYKADGTFSPDMTPISAYCTGTPTITASIKGTEQIASAGGYFITRSDGYIFAANGRGMELYPDAQGRVYAAWVFGPGYRHRMSAALMADAGEPAAVARGVLRALSMDEAALLSGNVYMTERLLAANFGALVDTEVSKTWGYTVTELPTTPPQTIIPVAGVPATGAEDEFLMCALILLHAGIIVYDRRRRL